MTYNIHPIFVHFPIAFFLLYSLLVIVPFERLFSRVSWKETRFVILLAGVLGAMIASSTGEIAEHLVRQNRQIVEMHSLFAALSTWVYGLILGGEILALAIPYIEKKFPTIPARIFILFRKVEKILTNKTLVVLLAVVGIIAITVTGLLGGVMVYGKTADPLAPIVLKILGLQ